MKTLIALTVALLVSLTACAGSSHAKDAGVNAEPKTTKLEAAYDDCDVAAGNTAGGTIELADGNRSLLIHGAKTDDLTDVACLVVQLDTPEYLIAEMDNTTALMGRQHEEAGGISYDWSYHPDNGLDMVLHEG